MQSADPEVLRSVWEYRYREKFKLSHKQFLEEPVESIDEYIMFFSLDSERAKLEEERRQAQNSNKT